MKISPVGKGKTQIGRTAQFDADVNPEFQEIGNPIIDEEMVPTAKRMTVEELRRYLGNTPGDYVVWVADSGSLREIIEAWADKERQSFIIGL